MKKNDDKKWGDFCDEYDENVLVNLRPRSRCEILISLRHFTRIMKAKSLQHRKPATVGPFYAPINPPKWVRFARRSPIRHFFEKAPDHVKQPIKDSSGQSVHVDGYLGGANSLERRIVADALGRIGRKIRNADGASSSERWKELFE